MALLSAIVFSIAITPSLSQTTSCWSSSGTCKGSSSSSLKAVSGVNVVCYDFWSCRYADITSTASVYLFGFEAANYATITAVNVYCRGMESAEGATITASALVELAGDYCANDAKRIEAPLVRIYGRGAAVYADDIIANTVDIKGYQGAWNTKITASKVDVTVERGGYFTEFHPKDGSLDITFNGYQAGYSSDILCEDSDCSIRCATPDSCYDVIFYCVGTGDCSYNQECGDDTGASSYCLSFYKEGVNGLTAVDIYELYEKNKARRHAPTDEEPISDDPNQPDGPPDSPTNPINYNFFSLSTGQFVVLCGLIAVLFALSTASCIYTIKTSKNKGFGVVEKEDFQ